MYILTLFIFKKIGILMKNKIIDSFFKSNKKKDTREDENNQDLLLHIF